jgi:hypothetical protein
MPVSKPFRNDQVERMTERFPFVVPEHSLGRTIPQEYGSVRSCRDDRIARRLYDCFKVDWPPHHP